MSQTQVTCHCLLCAVRTVRLCQRPSPCLASGRDGVCCSDPGPQRPEEEGGLVSSSMLAWLRCGLRPWPWLWKCLELGAGRYS